MCVFVINLFSAKNENIFGSYKQADVIDSVCSIMVNQSIPIDDYFRKLKQDFMFYSSSYHLCQSLR